MGETSDPVTMAQTLEHMALFFARSRKWKAHRVIVYAASNFFLKAGEGAFQEGQTKHIELKEMDPTVLDKVLTYIYKHDYEAEAESAITLHPEVYKLADFLDMQPLKQLVRKKFADTLKEDWEVGAFTKALRAVYTSTPPTDRGLRDIAQSHLGLHQKTLREHKGFMELIEANFADGRFVVDVLDAWTQCKGAKAASKASSAAGVAKKAKATKVKKVNGSQS
ncbi:MAG: hypothetical protein Q9195_003774 [Heterodermia aff. obscurata]